MERLRRRTHSMNTPAPVLKIRYECPVCKMWKVADAYEGPPVCQGISNNHKEWMVALSLIQPEDYDPLADCRGDGQSGSGVR